MQCHSIKKNNIRHQPPKSYSRGSFVCPISEVEARVDNMANNQDQQPSLMNAMLDLEDYQVSPTHGFLPSSPPIERLSDYYEEWEDICSNLYTLRINGQLTDRVARMPMLNTKHLKTEPEWRRAYVLLTYIASAYIWGPMKPLKVRFWECVAMRRS